MLRSSVPNSNGANDSGDLRSVDALAVFVSRPQVVCINTAALRFILRPFAKRGQPLAFSNDT